MSHWKRILRVLGRPSSELYEMKYYKLWPIWPTVIILLSWFAAEVLSAYGMDFKFNYRKLTEINILYIFLQNFSGEVRIVTLLENYKDLLTGEICTGKLEMPVNGTLVLHL